MKEEQGKTESAKHTGPKPPNRPTPTDQLPDALTFFVTRSERRAVLRALRAVDPDRSRALLRLVVEGGGCAHA